MKSIFMQDIHSFKKIGGLYLLITTIYIASNFSVPNGAGLTTASSILFFFSFIASSIFVKNNNNKYCLSLPISQFEWFLSKILVGLVLGFLFLIYSNVCALLVGYCLSTHETKDNLISNIFSLNTINISIFSILLISFVFIHFKKNKIFKDKLLPSISILITYILIHIFLVNELKWWIHTDQIINNNILNLPKLLLLSFIWFLITGVIASFTKNKYESILLSIIICSITIYYIYNTSTIFNTYWLYTIISLTLLGINFKINRIDKQVLPKQKIFIIIQAIIISLSISYFLFLLTSFRFERSHNKVQIKSIFRSPYTGNFITWTEQKYPNLKFQVLKNKTTQKFKIIDVNDKAILNTKFSISLITPSNSYFLEPLATKNGTWEQLQVGIYKGKGKLAKLVKILNPYSLQFNFEYLSNIKNKAWAIFGIDSLTGTVFFKNSAKGYSLIQEDLNGHIEFTNFNIYLWEFIKTKSYLFPEVNQFESKIPFRETNKNISKIWFGTTPKNNRMVHHKVQQYNDILYSYTETESRKKTGKGFHIIQKLNKTNNQLQTYKFNSKWNSKGGAWYKDSYFYINGFKDKITINKISSKQKKLEILKIINLLKSEKITSKITFSLISNYFVGYFRSLKSNYIFTINLDNKHSQLKKLKKGSSVWLESAFVKNNNIQLIKSIKTFHQSNSKTFKLWDITKNTNRNLDHFNWDKNKNYISISKTFNYWHQRNMGGY